MVINKAEFKECYDLCMQHRSGLQHILARNFLVERMSLEASNIILELLREEDKIILSEIEKEYKMSTRGAIETYLLGLSLKELSNRYKPRRNIKNGQGHT